MNKILQIQIVNIDGLDYIVGLSSDGNMYIWDRKMMKWFIYNEAYE